MENERYTDKDCDGLPDFIDSTFDTVDELLEKKGKKKKKQPEPDEKNIGQGVHGGRLWQKTKISSGAAKAKHLLYGLW